jgi:hypothetical protein
LSLEILLPPFLWMEMLHDSKRRCGWGICIRFLCVVSV